MIACIQILYAWEVQSYYVVHAHVCVVYNFSSDLVQLHNIANVHVALRDVYYTKSCMHATAKVHQSENNIFAVLTLNQGHGCRRSLHLMVTCTQWCGRIVQYCSSYDMSHVCTHVYLFEYAIYQLLLVHIIVQHSIPIIMFMISEQHTLKLNLHNGFQRALNGSRALMPLLHTGYTVSY